MDWRIGIWNAMTRFIPFISKKGGIVKDSFFQDGGIPLQSDIRMLTKAQGTGLKAQGIKWRAWSEAYRISGGAFISREKAGAYF
jgi:hypothetical protein